MISWNSFVLLECLRGSRKRRRQESDEKLQPCGGLADKNLFLKDLEKEIAFMSNKLNFAITKPHGVSKITYQFQYLFRKDVIESDCLKLGSEIISNSDCYEFEILSISSIDPSDVFIKAGTLSKLFLQYCLVAEFSKELEKFGQSNTFSRTFKLGVQLKPHARNKRGIFYVSFKRALELTLKKLLKSQSYTGFDLPSSPECLL